MSKKSRSCQHPGCVHDAEANLDFCRGHEGGFTPPFIGRTSINVVEAVAHARQSLLRAQAHLRRAADILVLTDLKDSGHTKDQTLAMLVMVGSIDTQLGKMRFPWDTGPVPGSAAIGVRCHDCGRLPGPQEHACSWTNHGKALCFGCGHR